MFKFNLHGKLAEDVHTPLEVGGGTLRFGACDYFPASISLIGGDVGCGLFVPNKDATDEISRVLGKFWADRKNAMKEVDRCLDELSRPALAKVACGEVSLPIGLDGITLTEELARRLGILIRPSGEAYHRDRFSSLEDLVRELCKRKLLVRAIRVWRACTGMGLMESKEAVEAIRDEKE